MDPIDQNATEAEAFEDLHSAIEEGQFETVRRIVENHGQEQHFSFDDTSALYKAFDCEKYDIISFLIHKGAKFIGSEHRYVYNFDIDLDRLNLLLLQYNKRSECSGVYKLMSRSQSPQELVGERLNELLSMYQYFFSTDIIRVLMGVLENVDFDIVFDFESDDVNRMHRLYNQEAEIFGLTLSNSNEIFVGAENLLSGEPDKRAKVYGVVAEEICHLALTTVFQNDAKPYKEGDPKLAQQFQSIVLAVKAFVARSCHTEPLIQDVYEWYHACSWECELIARVPHLVGVHGHEPGRRILQESSELSMLLRFYETHVLEKCRSFTDRSVNTKHHREMERLLKKDLISFKEKRIEPLKEGILSFRRYLVERGRISVITTNCARLCMLHVYHELKKEYDQLVEKKCLFFSRKCFEKNVNRIRDTLKGNLWEYLILVMDKSELNLSRFQDDYLEGLEEVINNGLRLIMISSSQSIDHEFDFCKAVNYRWSDLSEEFKTAQEGIKYVFKGEEYVTYVTKENFPKVFSDDDISMLLGGELIEIDDGNELYSQGYVPDTYIEREFHSTVADEKIFQNLSPDTNIVLSGWNEGELRDAPFDQHLVQWLQGSEDEIRSDKSIFLIDKATRITTEAFARNCLGKKNIWLQYDDKVFYVRDSSDDVFSGHVKQKCYSEDEMLKHLKRKRVVLICDNAGYGKSTVISNLIYKLKRNDLPSWNWRINFAKFAGDERDSLSVANLEEGADEEGVLDHLFIMLGLNNGFEKHLFWEYSNAGRCFIFFDGFDELPSDYVSRALKLLSTVRKRTGVNMVISTRKHHQDELERLLNAYSHQLVPFSRKDRVTYLEKLWRNKLKYPGGRGSGNFLKDGKMIPAKINNIIQKSKKRKSHSEREFQDLIVALEGIDLRGSLESLRSKINELEFTKLAESIIDRTSLDKLLEFMGIPLHLFMIGVIYYDSNFDADIPGDIHGVYSTFVDQKVRIFVEEKQGWLCAGPLKERTLKNEKRNAYRVHIQLANQLMGEKKVKENMTQEDLELCASLGIVCIKGAQIDFLHFTFAEFFKAESVRTHIASGSFVLGASVVILRHPSWGSNPGPVSQKRPGPSWDPMPHWNKYVFANVIFERKYHVVRRFLSSALARNGFENLTREFFQDVDFLVCVVLQFVHRCSSSYYRLCDDQCEVAKILKSLLDAFERTADEDLSSAFVAKLESGLSTLTEPFSVGGCLPLKTLKVLLRFEVKLLFGAVEFNSNPAEVVEVLNECVAILAVGEPGGNEREKRMMKRRGLAKLLSFKGSTTKGLIGYAVWNSRVEILSEVLKFSKEVFGEGYIDEVVQSEEYALAILEFLMYSDVERIRRLLKQLRSVFGNEMELLFDANLKFSMLRRTLWTRDESRSTFGDAISLFVEYFGIEALRQVLLFLDSHGDGVMQCLVTQDRHVLENLELVGDVLNDRIKMKCFLRCKDGRFRNVFHFVAANRFVDFRHVVEFCRDHLEKNEIEEMLAGEDITGVNALHLLFKHKSLGSLISGLDLIKATLSDVNLFKESLKSRDARSVNAFHLVATNENEIDLSFLGSHLNQSEMKDLLIQRDARGRTCLHFGANFHSKNLASLIDYSHETLRNDVTRFEELILAEDCDGETFLHLLVDNYYVCGRKEYDYINAIVKSLKDKLLDDHFERLLRLKNKEGKTFLQKDKIKNKRTIECFEAIVEKNLSVEPE